MLLHPTRFVARARRMAQRAALLLLPLCAPFAHAGDIARTGGPYVPTPQEVVERMLQLAEVGPRDFVIDLGSGDGRMVLTAARRYGARGLGVDIDSELVAASNAEAQRQGVADRVQFRVEDVTHTPLREASVVTLYLLPGLTRQLQPRFLSELAPGSRIVAHDFDFGDWKADRELVVDVKEKYGSPGTWKSTLFLWIVPARIGGLWHLEVRGAAPRRVLARFDQRFQTFAGTAMIAGASHPVSAGRIAGRRVEFRLGVDDAATPALYEGVADGDAMRGTVQVRGERVEWSATRVAPGAALLR